MPHKDKAARLEYLRDRYAARLDVRVADKERLQEWRKENPGKVSAQNRRNYSKQKASARVRNRLWYERNRDRMRTKRGLPEPTRPMSAACEMCGKPNSAGKVLALDHCHRTNRFRGWLCNRCNAGLGSLDDSIGGLLRAIRYLLLAEASWAR